MTRSILCGLLALVSVGALGVVPIACQSGGLGDPCTPEEEYNTQFPGFKVAQEFIESRSFQCATRVCLVNHFQGRVSCPYGQDQIKACNGPKDTTTCGEGSQCVESSALTPECDCKSNVPGDCARPEKCGGVQGLVCDPKLKICTCTTDAPNVNGIDYYCTVAEKGCNSANCTRVLKAYVCHKPGDCQNSDQKDEKNDGKQCCVPGSDTPVGVPVCGQCAAESHRNADDAVYCSCRCCPKCCDDPGVEDGEPCETDKTICGEACDPNFNYCSCPSGFSCSKIRPKVGLGDEQLTGAYCIKDATAFTSTANCNTVGVRGVGCVGGF